MYVSCKNAGHRGEVTTQHSPGGKGGWVGMDRVRIDRGWVDGIGGC